MPCFPKWSLPLYDLYAIHNYLVQAAYSTHLISLHLITLTILGRLQIMKLFTCYFTLFTSLSPSSALHSQILCI
jgi:hypothetical protein